MLMPFVACEKTVSITSGDGAPIQVSFPWRVAQVIPFGAVLVVRTEPRVGACDNRNVSAIDTQGRTVWTVRERRHVYADSPYTKIACDNGKLKLVNWDGLAVVVDPSTWEELSADYGR